MDNPFVKRASEQLRDDEAFLAVVSPEPVTYFLSSRGKAGTLYDRLLFMQGTPGSGKTTLARLFEFPPLTALLRNRGSSNFQALAGALAECGAIQGDMPSIIGCRLTMETDYRDVWEFPYSETLKIGLLTTFVQARAVLAWFRHLASAGVPPARIRIVPRPDAETAVESIGGTAGEGVLARAREVEAAAYEVVGALIAPKEEGLSQVLTGAYRPFDVIDRITVEDHDDPSKSQSLHPLVILDDANYLHPSQFRALQHWLARRELRIARWMIARFDILQPKEALAAVTEDREARTDFPGLTASRDIEVVLLQSSGPRREQRAAFRRMAKDMAGRYLQKHSLLGPRGLTILVDMLGEQEELISPSSLRELGDMVDAAQRRLKVTVDRRAEFEKEIDEFRSGGKPVPPDIRMAMLMVLLHRYDRRRKEGATLFDSDPEPSRPIVANPGVHEAARLHLLHRYGHAFYYGIDDLCDSSSENAELFLQLSAVLVDTVATQVIRSKGSHLTAGTQSRLLRQRADWIMSKWSFPYVDEVRQLVAGIGKRCVQVTLEPNGWLTPNAYGIPQKEFDDLATTHPGLARVLQYAIAYNAVLPVPNYKQGSKVWCLLELGGMVILAHGLSLKRGGFLEGESKELATMLEDRPS
jgi:hypothetical protein